ncbi:hypothetical protein CC78DRAFT_517462 [Lojkania enalia]|uniref:Origin recognition complex subunit 4 n=1 Tax=Lojkania enalia TaxID=147567 RepID=A0A9P4K8I2_9PLEO|nr:hypothetical protein CC78DRAFT_517462 [Didymosphaeria enalia]
MDGSPRSLKRRKLDTPTRIVSSPLAKQSPKKAVGRPSTRATSYANGETNESVCRSTTRSHLSRTAATSNRTLHEVADEEGLYDDIDGALRAKSPASTPTTTLASKKRKQSKSKYILDPSLPHPFKRKPDINTVANGTSATSELNGATNEGGSKWNASRNLVDGIRYSATHEPEIEDKIVVDRPTSRRPTQSSERYTGTTTNKIGKRGRGPRLGGRKALNGDEAIEKSTNTDELQENGTTGTTPSRLRATRKAIGNITGRRLSPARIGDDGALVATPSRSSTRNGVTPNSEDELGDREHPSTGKNAKQRRRLNRTDHISNRDEDIIVGREDEPDVAGAIEDDVDVDGASVLDPTEPSPFNTVCIQQKKDVSALLSGNLKPARELDLLKSIVLERITAKRAIPLVGLEEEYKSVYQLIEHTITAGEGNSMLVIGARGSGKTALVNKVLSEVSKDNSDDYHVVRLNGFIHTDDKIALREIWRQLGKEMDIEESEGVSKNYADTLTTLLALLSHPVELTGEITEHVAKAVIFIMDEFDLFAMHPRQTLLYNLFDIAQSRKAPIAVLGLTTKIDVTNSLEKRVKSRFSHRYVHLSLAKTFTAFQEICKASLIVQPDQLNVEERSILSSALTTTPIKMIKKPTKPDFLGEWNSNMESLFATKSFLVQQLSAHFYLTKSVSTVQTSFLLPTATLSPATSHIIPSSALTPPDSRLSLLPTLSTLALSLLIAAARLDIIHDSDTCNFNMAYDEYVTLASKARIQSAAGGASASGAVSKVWGKDAAKKEWEGLAELGFVVPVVQGQAGGFGMCRVDVALEEIGGVLAREKGVDKGLERWCRQL